LKKLLIERQCHGLLEFIEPKWTLDTVVGHQAAKERLREDAALLKRGSLDSMPMGYLVCGPVGTGKSFLAQCVSGEIGAPCVMLKNFRSKYVGETEGNLERVLSVLRAMGPVVVIVDEADVALGGREQDGDSGTSSRVFGMIASQMGDTRYRGRIIWMLLTARPDLLPIDLKRQGRAEVHIPLFYPTDESEIRQMFTILARTSPRFRNGDICRALTSKAWSAARGANRCSPAMTASPRTHLPTSSRNLCRQRRAWSASCRRSPPSSSAPTANSCRRRSSSAWTRKAGAPTSRRA
jgi:SpoVK/Ycf46/Vps4 family AAA+-type ATPase